MPTFHLEASFAMTEICRKYVTACYLSFSSRLLKKCAKMEDTFFTLTSLTAGNKEEEKETVLSPMNESGLTMSVTNKEHTLLKLRALSLI